jgi:hypothetical protein
MYVWKCYNKTPYITNKKMTLLIKMHRKVKQVLSEIGTIGRGKNIRKG